jgi:hypothetical protein
MVKKEVNVLIWEEVDKCEENIKNFLKEVLLLEREHLDEVTFHYPDAYERLIDKYSKKATGDLYEDI